MTNLPENWCICCLSEIASLIRGVSYDKSDLGIEDSTHICLLRANNIQDGNIIYDDVQHVSSSVIDSLQNMKKFDILIAMSSGSKNLVGKTAQYLRNERDITFGAFCSVVRPDKNINPIFLGKFFQTNTYRKIVSGISKGVNINNLKNSHINNLSIPFPPLAEQGRIVAKIEELFAGIDAGVENLKSVKNQIALYRQSVLKSAFDFDASTFSVLKNLIDKVRYGTSKKCSTEENVNSMPVYRIPNIDFKKGVLDKTDLKFASFDDSEKSSLMLKSGDILIIRSNGSLNLVGRAALVYNTDTNGLYAGYLMRLRIKDTEKLLPKFLLHFLNSGKARAYIEEKAKSTSGVNNINSEEISDLQIPVPTLAEQEKIVAEIESRFERADALETAVDRALNDAEKLKQAVLKKAFSGELVPQNPDDEPASVLLDRIRAARASELSAKKGKRKR